MAQSANKRTPLGIDGFRDKPTRSTSLRGQLEGTIQISLARKENMILGTLLDKPEMVILPQEPYTKKQ